MRGRAFYAGTGIENTWIAQEDQPGKRVLDVFLQMDHYERWEGDLSLAADLGVNAIRYSVPWYRSEPAPGRFDWDWIAGPLEWFRRRDITAIVDLLHYGTPTWLENGLLKRAFPERLADYAQAFARRFDGVVDHYTPVNEPQTAASMMGWHGVWPPYLHGIDVWLTMLVPAARAVVLCTQALRAASPAAVLISADCDFTPPFDAVAAAAGMAAAAAGPLDAREQLIHDAFAGMLAYGAVPRDHPTARAVLRLGLPESALEWFRGQAARPDIVGFNDYPDFAKTGYEEAGGRLLERLRILHGILGLPVYVTETSAGRDEAKSSRGSGSSASSASRRGPRRLENSSS